jgi:hypothetical protein
MNEMRGLLENPDLGKADLKSALIDSTSKIVADRMMSPSVAVAELTTFPDRPYDQRKWVEQKYAQAVQAQAGVLDHHRSSAIGTGNYELENLLHDDDADPDGHMKTISGLIAAHYGAARA